MTKEEFNYYRGKSVLIRGEVLPVVGYDPTSQYADIVVGLPNNNGWYSENGSYSIPVVLEKEAVSYCFADKEHVID